MTKIKNTKKGMAKKTLSISLAVAMLATSNVPVWAAEFTDGTDAVFTSEVEAPVVEEEVAPVAEDAAYTATIKLTGTTDNSVVWNAAKNIKAELELKNDDAPTNIKFKYAWKVNGLASEENDVDLENGKMKIDGPTLAETDAGKTLVLDVYALDTNNGNSRVWGKTSDEIAVKAKESSKLDTIKFKDDAPLTYKGTAYTVEEIKDALDWSKVGNENNYTVSVSGDTTNVTDDGFDVTITCVAPGYEGSKTIKGEIKPLTLDGTKDHMISEHMVASLKTTSFAYTGNVIRVKAADVTLTDKDSKEDLSNYLKADEYGYISLEKTGVQTVGNEKFRLNLATPETGNKNYDIAAVTTTGSLDADGYRTIETDNYAEITARDLSTVEVTIKPQAVPGNGKIELNDTNVTIKDKTTGEKLNLGVGTTLEYKVPAEATKKGSYDVTFTPASTNENVKGTATGKLVLVGADISGAKFSNELSAEEYTGEAVTKTAKQLGSVTLDGKVLDESTYEIKYANNVNAGTAKIIIVGKESFEGSQAEYEFTINPAKVTADDITAEKEVELKDTTKPADYAESMNLVVKAKNAAKPAKVFTLKEGEDYTVKYSLPDGNEVEKTVKAEITITNKNFKGNDTVTFNKTSDIVAKSLKAENIKLKETDFTYTGKAITPEFDVVIDGKIINPVYFDVEYTNNINAGTATLTVKGKDDQTVYGKKAVKVTYTIKPASVDSLKGVIKSKEYTGYSLELADEDFNLTLDGTKVNVRENFTLTYGENVAIGDGTVTLTPKNNNFTGTRTFTFKITADMLKDKGTFEYYMNGVKVSNKDAVFTYDGTAHTFDKVVFTYGDTDVKLVEGKDYELVYADNICGKEETDGQYGVVLAVAKGKYGAEGTYTDADGNTTANVIAQETFKIEQLNVNRSSINVSNGVYAGGLPVKPEVTVVVKGVKLVEGKDYELKFEGMTDSDRVNATASKNLNVTITPINGYKTEGDLSFDWGIDKFNLENAVVTVDGDKVTVKCGRVDVETSEYTVESKDGKVTVTAVKDSKNYTGSKTVDARTQDQKPATPMLVDVKVNGNKATAVLSGESDGAMGYDYVISTDKNCITNKDYDKVNKNILKTTTDFTYVQQGVYYAYCHAWTRDENGQKVFSDWSNAYPFAVEAITPETPVVTSVSVKGSTVTVKYTAAAKADGYDVVLGSAVKTVAGEKRPVEYGTLVKKNIKGNVVTATFKNVPKGTYYAGLHAFNRTNPENNTKVFSPWSNTKKVTVK